MCHRVPQRASPDSPDQVSSARACAVTWVSASGTLLEGRQGTRRLGRAGEPSPGGHDARTHTINAAGGGTRLLRRFGGNRPRLMIPLAALAVSATGCGTAESEKHRFDPSRIHGRILCLGGRRSDIHWQNRSAVRDAALVQHLLQRLCRRHRKSRSGLHGLWRCDGRQNRGTVGDTPITSRTTCEATRVGVVFYEGSAATAAAVNTSGTTGYYTEYDWVALENEEQYGRWVSAFGAGTCTFDVSLTGLASGTTYRVAATARTPSNSTRKVSIGTYKPIKVH